MESAQPATVFCWLKHIVGIPNLPQFSEMGLAIPEALKEEEEHDDDDDDDDDDDEKTYCQTNSTVKGECFAPSTRRRRRRRRRAANRLRW